MSKISLLLGIAGLAVLYLSGVVRVEFSPEKLSAVPGTVSNLVSDASFLTSAKNQAISWKRDGELYFADSAEKKMDLALQYTEADSKRLQEALDGNKEPQVLVPDAELLAESIERMREYAGQLSEEDLVAVQDRSRQIASTAGGVLGKLKDVQRDYAEFEERLAGVTDKLEIYLESAVPDQGEVAGAKDESDKETQEEGSSKIPLQF